MAAVIPAVTKVSSRIIRVLGCNPGVMTLQGTNTYIIGTGKRRILLDTGEGGVPEYINHLKDLLANEHFSLSHIFLSHWHADHIGGLREVLNLDETNSYCQVWKFPCKSKEDEFYASEEINHFKDGQELSVEGATLRVIYTPGHTTDHAVFLLLEENAIFSGDCVLGEGTAVFENLYDYMNSLETILELKPNIIYPGHGNIINDPLQKIQYYIQHRNEREVEILKYLEDQPNKLRSEIDIVKAVYKDTPEKLWKAAAFNVNHHLHKLLKEGRVTRVENMWQHTDKYPSELED